MDAQSPWPKLSREQLIELAERIMSADGSEEEIETWTDEFDAAVLMPDASSLIFWPSGYDSRRDEPPIADYDPTPEEVVDAVLAYQPIVL